MKKKVLKKKTPRENKLSKGAQTHKASTFYSFDIFQTFFESCDLCGETTEIEVVIHL